MPSASVRRLARSLRPVDALPADAHVPVADPDAAALIAARERHVAELSARPHAMTAGRSIVGDELHPLRAGQKSAVEIAATLAARRIATA